jgi:protein lifeguard
MYEHTSYQDYGNSKRYGTRPSPSPNPINPTNSTQYNQQPIILPDESQVFKTIYDRHQFIQKVYSNLSCMLLMTVAICAGFMYNHTLNQFARTPAANALLWLSFVLLIGIIIGISCNESFVRKSPNDYCILVLFTLLQSYMIGLACAVSNVNAVFMAAGTTLAITISMTLFAFQTKYDCTGWGGFLFGALVGIIVMNIINMFLSSPILHLWLGILGVVLFTAYLVYDTQMIIGGEHKKYQFSEEDHVFATINLYLDILNIFMQLLSLFDRD